MNQNKYEVWDTYHTSSFPNSLLLFRYGATYLEQLITGGGKTYTEIRRNEIARQNSMNMKDTKESRNPNSETKKNLFDVSYYHPPVCEYNIDILKWSMDKTAALEMRIYKKC